MGDEEKEDPSVSRLRRSRLNIFDSMLSFNAKRITLQQLFSWTREFRVFLRNTKLNDLMNQYEDVIRLDGDEWATVTQGAEQIGKMSSMIKRLPPTFEEFADEYLSVLKAKYSKDFLPEMRWLFEGVEVIRDLCKRMYPFWSGMFINSIYNFMESTEQIQGNYELKCAEFGQLKYSLSVNDESAFKLFHIIRFKHRSLSWQQIYQYLTFVLRMKYNVQKAITKAKQSEDTTVSSDGMKIVLKISVDDSSKWLFQKTLFYNASKVTWKQIRGYLKKTETVRDNVRDIFADKERARSFDENRAEIIAGIKKNVDQSKNKIMDSDAKTDQLLELMLGIKKQNDELKEQNVRMEQEINELKERLSRAPVMY